jgi:hypothetical protein
VSAMAKASRDRLYKVFAKSPSATLLSSQIKFTPSSWSERVLFRAKLRFHAANAE